MGVTRRFKQVALAVGLLTILAGVAMAGAAVYLWWDGRKGTGEFETETDFDADRDLEAADEIDA